MDNHGQSWTIMDNHGNIGEKYFRRNTNKNDLLLLHSHHIVRRQAEIQTDIAKQLIHQSNNLNHHLVLTDIVSILYHHTQNTVSESIADVYIFAVPTVFCFSTAVLANRTATSTAMVAFVTRHVGDIRVAVTLLALTATECLRASAAKHIVVLSHTRTRTTAITVLARPGKGDGGSACAVFGGNHRTAHDELQGDGSHRTLEDLGSSRQKTTENIVVVKGKNGLTRQDIVVVVAK